MRALDAVTGTLVWQDRISACSGARSLDFANGQLFAGGWEYTAGGENATVRAYDASSGRLLWKHLPPGAPGFTEALTHKLKVHQRLVIASQAVRDVSPPHAHVALIQAYDADSGAVRWTERFEAGGDFEDIYDLDVSGGRLFVTGVGGSACFDGPFTNCDAIIRGYDLQSGRLQWNRQLDLSGIDDYAYLVTARQGTVFVFSQAASNYVIPGCCLIGEWVVQAFDFHGRMLWQSDGGRLDSAVYNMAVEGPRLFIPGRSVSRENERWDWIVHAYDIRGRRSDVEPVVSAPRNFLLTGTSGQRSFEIYFYGTSPAVTSHGLIPGEEQSGTVLDDPTNNINNALRTGVGVTAHTLSVPAGTRHFRVATFADETDGADDLDLYVFDPSGRLVGGRVFRLTADEIVHITEPIPGTYTVFVHGYATDGPDANYKLFAWPLGDTSAGNLTVSGPQPATGPVGIITASWFGLLSSRRYFGSINYMSGSKEVERTFVTVRP